MTRAGLLILIVVVGACFLSLPWSVTRYNEQNLSADVQQQPPSLAHPLGTDRLGRSLMWRCLLGGAISLGIGVCAAAISVSIGVTWGAVAGYLGGRTDAIMMRIVDVFYGLPYILLVVLMKIALQPGVETVLTGLHIAGAASEEIAAVVTLLIAIGGVSWLTMARVIRGQVLSLRDQPFVEAARATGVPTWRILAVHLLPNLSGPIIVYATLIVPQAILQESFLSFLGIGVQAPLPSWGDLASKGLGELHALASGISGIEWWLLCFPCLLLGLTLLSLNLLGDALQRKLDPRTPGYPNPRRPEPRNTRLKGVTDE